MRDMKEFSPFEPKQYRELKENRKDFYDVENMIESAKFKYNLELNTPKWLMATGLGFLFSAGISNLSMMPKTIFKFVAFWGFILALVEFFLALIIILELDRRQKIVMRYLYREKDKQDRLKKK